MAYILMGIVIWSANSSLGEMTAVFPVKGPIIDFCSRFIDESVGFAVGWMAWYVVMTSLPQYANGVQVRLRYPDGNRDQRPVTNLSIPFRYRLLASL